MRYGFLAACAVAALLPARAPAGPPVGPAPLLFVRLVGPTGTHVVLPQGYQLRDLPAPAVLGLRPGYIYRLQMDNFASRPGVRLFPTIEVRGTLNLPPQINALNYPAPVYLTEADIDAVVAGALVTKVVYLEYPERAVPAAQLPGEVFQTELPPREDLLNRAREFGRPLLVLRIGGRQLSNEDLLHEVVPGTVLFPGERWLAPPLAPPQLPYICWQWFDPIHGPRIPDGEYLCDGGDHGIKAGIGPEGQIGGIEPEDTVAVAVDSEGRRRIVCSNRVCLLVPRFAVLRSELPLGRIDTSLAPVDAAVARRQVLLEGQQPFQILRQNEILAARSNLVRLSGTENMVTAFVTARIEGAEVVTARVTTSDLSQVCETKVPVPPDKLCLTKCVDRPVAQVGEIVTFTLQYSNKGGRPLTDVAVVDSLTTRLEYVPGSARSDRAAVFTFKENEAGSVILRWDIPGVLQPGETGTLTFQARIR
jgi:uncharacterized repeat protein (TIGR01451 family)